ncbi:invasion protein [Cohnella sp. CIP 111063]|uniref:FAD-dependent oxidoreductase n=1 Tax=unclassified Cohnella TaxID=2636738 RepID=UPI000B8C5D93|nr:MULTISPECIES: FAD-dependent oxidoreductase [unclassified Cohnella]OXS53739.1 invasion protein [Cohnella sp. CIP 111063]PRX62025.1 FAD dependent oxidoreductase [Cohnella sp. SGD-V74]
MQKTAYSFEREVKTHKKADVIVVGGGPAGTAAAIGAARLGKKVVLLEKSAQLGGMGTLANVSIFMPVGNVTGIYREMIKEMLADDLPAGHDESIAPQYSPFLLRQYLNDKMKKEGVDVYFHCEFVGAVREAGAIRAVIVSTREGLRAFEGERVIDCTGDARVAIDAGVSYRTGREGDGLTQPMTLMFTMQNTGKPVKPYLPEGCYYYENVSDLPQGRRLYWEQRDDGVLLVNMSRVKANGADMEQVNYAETEALKQVFSIAHYLQRTGFETYAIAHIAPQTGVRETNQIEGRYTLTEEDVVGGSRFPDAVAQTNYEIDIHSPDAQKTTDERHVDGYDIPYGCMVPATGPDNLLVAGRAISATHVAMSSMRVQATCYALGQAAGIAAALSIEDAVPVGDVEVGKVQAELSKQDARLLGKRDAKQTQ